MAHLQLTVLIAPVEFKALHYFQENANPYGTNPYGPFLQILDFPPRQVRVDVRSQGVASAAFWLDGFAYAGLGGAERSNRELK